MEKGALIGKGMTAEVYEWGQDKVLKLYFEKYNEDWIKHEADIGYAIHASGVPSPAVYDMVIVNGRKGLIMQRLFGETLQNKIIAEPWMIYYYVKQLARLQYEIHKCSAEGLPNQKEKFEYAINRSVEILGDRQEKILKYVEALPDGTSVCHGDLYFGNIILSNHKLTAIDWNGAYCGNPLGDVARTCLIIISPSVPPGTLEIFNMLSQYAKGLVCWTYLNEYMTLAKVDIKDISAWLLPVAAAKLKDKVQGEEKWLMDIIGSNLKNIN